MQKPPYLNPAYAPDECSEGTDRCSQNCHNTVGSYRCSCNVGYRLNADGVTCDDINECDEGTDRCAQNCHNTIGSYTCSCNTGYRFNANGFDCDDIDECVEQLDECQQICNNTIGSYVCDCHIGYALNSDGRTCRDINECDLGIDRCDQNCHNNIGSYTCSCNAGWRLDFDGFRCNDINECLSGAIGNTTCHQVCVNTPGSYHCACFLGWRLTANRITCEDINECTDAELVHECDHTCINTVGSYACTCDSGYNLNVDGRACDDIDECTNNNDLCAQACINTPGSYVCNCTPGYVLDSNGFSCIDVDECILMTHICEQNCMNTPGSFSCFCNQTYTKTNDGLSCLGTLEDLLLTILGSRTMEIGWSTPRNDSRDGYFENFQVLCITQNDRSIIYTNTLTDRFATTDRIENVVPYTSYNCCVLMTTSLGSSPYACAAAVTDQDEPGSPPSTIDINHDSPFNLTVMWTPPRFPNGVITRYTFYIDYKNDTIVGLPFDPSTTDFVITGLSPYQLVGVSISASTIVGMGPNSTIANVRTAQTAPSEVSQPTSSVMDDNNVVITWDTPENENGVLLYYKVGIHNQLHNYSEIIRLMPNETKSVSFDDLEPEVPYTVEIVAATEAGVSEPFVQTIFTREGVPNVPNITALARLSGTRGVLTWQPYTLDTSKGFLTKFEVSYLTVPATSTRCPSSLNNAKIIRVEVNETRHIFTELQAEEEYCVAVKAWTAAGQSPSSEVQRLPLSQATLFQVRFQLPDGVFCNSYVAINMTQKIDDIERGIAEYVLANCNCEIFSDQYITQGILMCGNNLKEFIFQAKVLSTAEKTSDQFRDELIQKWVNEKPIIKIEKKSYQVDPYCTVELSDLRSTDCRSENPTLALSQTNGTKTSLQVAIEITAGVGGGVFAFILIACAVGIVFCCCSRKTVRRKYHEPHREGLDIQDPSANRNVTVAPFVPEQRSAFLVGANRDVGTLSRGTLNHGTLNRRSRIVDTYQPSYEPNESTLRRTVKKDKEVEADEDAPVNATYIDDDLEDEFDDY